MNTHDPPLGLTDLLGVLSKWQRLFGADDPEDAIRQDSRGNDARLLDERLAEIRKLSSLLLRCRVFVEQDCMMMADITRFAPLPADTQAKHDSTESLSEILLREMDSELC